MQCLVKYTRMSVFSMYRGPGNLSTGTGKRGLLNKKGRCGILEAMSDWINDDILHTNAESLVIGQHPGEGSRAAVGFSCVQRWVSRS